jgi:hypothetical protein
VVRSSGPVEPNRKPTEPKPWVIAEANRQGSRLYWAWKREVAAHEKAGEKLHPADPSDPWSESIWSPCDLTCIHQFERTS